MMKKLFILSMVGLLQGSLAYGKKASKAFFDPLEFPKEILEEMKRELRPNFTLKMVILTKKKEKIAHVAYMEKGKSHEASIKEKETFRGFRVKRISDEEVILIDKLGLPHVLELYKDF